MGWIKDLLHPKQSVKPLWFERYTSSQELTQNQKIFLSYYTEEAFSNILMKDMWYFGNSKYKLYVSEVVKAVEHYINTGEIKYFYEHGQGV